MLTVSLLLDSVLKPLAASCPDCSCTETCRRRRASQGLHVETVTTKRGQQPLEVACASCAGLHGALTGTNWWAHLVTAAVGLHSHLKLLVAGAGRGRHTVDSGAVGAEG